MIFLKIDNLRHKKLTLWFLSRQYINECGDWLTFGYGLQEKSYINGGEVTKRISWR
jgi:hypothetical protein